MDRNTVIGFVLLAGLLFAYLFLSTKGSKELEAARLRADDSVARVKLAADSLARLHDTSVVKKVQIDSTGFNKAIYGTEHTLVVENSVLRITFSNKGGQPKQVELKKYNSYDSTVVKLVDPASNDRMSYAINATADKSAQISELYFNDGEVTTSADGTQVVTFKLPATSGGQTIEHQYTLRKDDYLVDWNILFQGADKLVSQGNLNFSWQYAPLQHEKDPKYERRQSQLVILEDNEYDYFSIVASKDKKFEKSLQWLSIKQQFFNTTLIAKNSFTGGQISWVTPQDDTSRQITNSVANLNYKLPAGSVANVPLQVYYGPSDYDILKNVPVAKMDKIVNLGQGLYSFVRPVNIYVIMPVFNFFKSFIGSFGVVILLLTLFIRLLTSPLVYSSYLSGAKMKALRPEIEQMKKRLGGDQQAVGMEQMKLFREAGVNPLGGCIPALLQIPIFFALFSFFNANISLRGQSFLWSKNLAAYDSIWDFGNIPVISGLYGNHVSLFTLLAVATSFLISMYQMSMTPDQGNPAMKYMPYIFPFLLLGFFNSLPSALTWYYTVSNVITLALQWVIQNYIIDHDKILAKLQENRLKPKAKSKWAEKLEEMQEQQKKLQQNKGKK